MAFSSQPLNPRFADGAHRPEDQVPGEDGSMLGVRRLNASGMVLHTRRGLELGAHLALSLELPGSGDVGGRDASSFVHIRATVAGRRIVKESSIGRIYEVTLVFHPRTSEQQRQLGEIAADFPGCGIAVPSERNARTGEPNPLFGLN